MNSHNLLNRKIPKSLPIIIIIMPYRVKIKLGNVIGQYQK